jgi:hypothetical protein
MLEKQGGGTGPWASASFVLSCVGLVTIGRAAGAAKLWFPGLLGVP